MRTKRIEYQIDLIKGVNHEKKRTAQNAIRRVCNSMESRIIRNNDLNALFAKQPLSGRIKRTDVTIENTGLSCGCMIVTPLMT